MAGWIKLHRKLMKWEWYKKPNTFRLFLHCLLKANIKQDLWQGELVSRGQFVTSVKNLSNDLGLTDAQIRTSINHLQTSNQITIKTTNKYSVVTVVKYDDYQEQQKQDNKQTKLKLTSCLTTDKEERSKEERIKNKNKPKKGFTPPTIFELKEYFKEKGYNEQTAQKMFDSYSVANWHDSKGNKVKNWKQKAINVWFKDENKEPEKLPIGKLKMVY